MKSKNFLSKLWSSVVGSQRNDVEFDRRLTVGSPSGFTINWTLKLVSVLVLVLTIGVGNAWGAYTYSGTGTFNKQSTIDGNGYYVIVLSSSGAMTGSASSNYVGVNTGYNGSASSISNPATSIVLQVTNYDGTNKKYYINNNSGNYLYSSGDKKIAYSATSQYWEIATVSSKARLKTAQATVVYMGYVANSGFRPYTNSGSNVQSVSAIYKLAAATPTVTPDPTSLSWGTVLQGSSQSTKTISITGTNLTAGTLTISATGGYSVTPTSKSVSGTLAATTLTVTPPSTSTTGAKNGKVTISGGGLASSVEVNLSMTVNAASTVTWMNNGSEYTTTLVENGSKPTFPSNPSSCDGTSTTFYGWSTSEWSGKIDDISAKTIYTSAASMPTVSSAVTYYAVFCKGGGGSEVLNEEFDNNQTTDATTAFSSSTFSNFSGTVSRAYKSQYGGVKFGTGSYAGYITSKSLDLSKAFTVSIDACKYGSDNGSIEVTVGSTTKTISNSSLSAQGTFDTFVLEFDAATSTSTVKIGTSNNRAYIDNVVITTAGTASQYLTTCCTDPETALSITSANSVATGGTVSLTSTGGNGGTVTWSVVKGSGTATIAGTTLTAGSVGTVTVKAHQDATGGYCAQDDEQTFTIVSSTVNVTSVSVDPTSKAILVGETFTITPTVLPANATDKSVSWSSSASGKASVSSGTVTGVAAGSATITCTTTDGGKTATCATTVYSATVTSIVDESGTSISGSGVSASISARNLTASEGTTNYKFKNWEFVGSSNGLSISSTTSLSTTLTGTPSGNVSLKAVFYKPVTIAWKVGTDDAAAGSQTLNVKRGTEWKDLTLPSAPADNTLSACSNKFMGWTNGDELEGTGNSAPAVCLKSFSGVTTAIESPLTFRAVFATESAGGEAVNTVLFSEDFSGYSADDVPSGSVDNDHTGTTVYNGGSVTYSCTNGTKTSGTTAGGTTAVKNEYLAEGTAPEIMVGKKGSGDGAVGGTFVISGIPNGGASELTVSYKQNAKGLSVTASGTSYSGSKTANTKAEQSFDVTVGSGTMTLTFQATTTDNVRLDNIEVKVKTRGVTYSNYVTKCCTQHTITLAGSGSVTGGTFAADPTSACQDVEVHLSATPDESHEFDSWTITNTSTGDDVTDDVTLVDNDFLMPDYGVTVTATFAALTEYSVTWMVDGTTWSEKGGSTIVYQGRRISTLPTAPDYEDFCGDVFIGWTTVANYVHGSSPLYTKASDFPTASADQIFYAVFADFNE